MEDLSSLEISRAQIWQWSKHGTILNNGEVVNNELIKKVIELESEEIHLELQASIQNDKSLLEQEEFLVISKLYF